MWTDTELSSNTKTRCGLVWRCVEAQHAPPSMTDSTQEQDALSALIKKNRKNKPRQSKLNEALAWPFSQVPGDKNGSRFKAPRSKWGVYYSAEQRLTALAEHAHGRRKFFLKTEKGTLPKKDEPISLFAVGYRSRNLLDLTDAPFNQDREKWVHPDDHSDTQVLVGLARNTGITVICYESVRDPKSNPCYAILTADVFTSQQPTIVEKWTLKLGQEMTSTCNESAPDVRFEIGLA